jgi:hypothetical protein
MRSRSRRSQPLNSSRQQRQQREQPDRQSHKGQVSHPVYPLLSAPRTVHMKETPARSPIVLSSRGPHGAVREAHTALATTPDARPGLLVAPAGGRHPHQDLDLLATDAVASRSSRRQPSIAPCQRSDPPWSMRNPFKHNHANAPVKSAARRGLRVDQMTPRQAVSRIGSTRLIREPRTVRPVHHTAQYIAGATSRGCPSHTPHGRCAQGFRGGASCCSAPEGGVRSGSGCSCAESRPSGRR